MNLNVSPPSSSPFEVVRLITKEWGVIRKDGRIMSRHLTESEAKQTVIEYQIQMGVK